MKLSHKILTFCFTFCFATHLAGQRFACDGQLLIASSNGVSTNISRPIYIPFSTPFLSPFVNYANGSFDALGFNSKDNYIYAVEQNTNTIVRLKRNNSFERIGNVSIVDTLKSHAGDCTPDGFYLCHENTLNQILVFDVTDQFKLLQQIDLFWDPLSVNSGPFNTSIFDFAIDPNNPSVAYAYQGASDHPELKPDTTQSFLLQINLNFNDANLGMVTPLAETNSGIVKQFGSLLFSPQSVLYGFGSSDTGLNPVQDKLYTINQFSGEVNALNFSTTDANISDGCSCPFSFNFSNAVPTEGMYCNNDIKSFILQINNDAFIPVEGITLKDTFPEGMIIEEVIGMFSGNISNTAGQGIGTNVLVINDLQIPSKSIIEIKVRVRSIDAVIGSAFNQAFLHELPPRFGGVMASDNRGTSGVPNDASKFTVIPRELENVEWEISPPTNCLEANDGSITVSSESFFPGEFYSIKLRNKLNWEESTTQVLIDENNSFTIDSLIPGDYQVFELKSLNENCSLAVKDTTIIIEAPNESISIQTSSNSPICEGENLELNAIVSPQGDIRWSGPQSFGSESFDPMIENAIEKNSGEYKIEVNYGYCQIIELLEAEVKPNINSSIFGDTEYCERDKIYLEVKGTGTNLNHTWQGPNNLIRIDSTLSIPAATNLENGFYRVISDNGACSDTADIEITILPTPTISIDDKIIADFCEAVQLNPIISGDNNVDYTWFPKEGLDCFDCPTPQVMPIVQPSYSLKVENDYFCSDSAAIKIVLDTQKLVYAPNIFAENSALGNDRFSLFPSCVVNQILSLEIFDRWGNSVFTQKNFTLDQNETSWDGYINSRLSQSGVYIWYAEIELIDGSKKALTGSVSFFFGGR